MRGLVLDLFDSRVSNATSFMRIEVIVGVVGEKRRYDALVENQRRRKGRFC